MTYEQAIKTLENYKEVTETYNPSNKVGIEALRMGIEALTKQKELKSSIADISQNNGGYVPNMSAAKWASAFVVEE